MQRNSATPETAVTNMTELAGSLSTVCRGRVGGAQATRRRRVGGAQEDCKFQNLCADGA